VPGQLVYNKISCYFGIIVGIAKPSQVTLQDTNKLTLNKSHLLVLHDKTSCKNSTVLEFIDRRALQMVVIDNQCQASQSNETNRTISHDNAYTLDKGKKTKVFNQVEIAYKQLIQWVSRDQKNIEIVNHMNANEVVKAAAIINEDPVLFDYAYKFLTLQKKANLLVCLVNVDIAPKFLSCCNNEAKKKLLNILIAKIPKEYFTFAIQNIYYACDNIDAKRYLKNLQKNIFQTENQENTILHEIFWRSRSITKCDPTSGELKKLSDFFNKIFAIPPSFEQYSSKKKSYFLFFTHQNYQQEPSPGSMFTYYNQF
jgi:hypothetical protein